MASQTRPGVEVIQQIQTTPTVTIAPDLVPVVVGVCNQIVEAVDSEGALNPDAKFAGSRYNQAAVQITQAEFPDPRSNIDEINVYEESVRGFLFFGGRMVDLTKGSNGYFGQSFLKATNYSQRAVIRASVDGPYAFGGLVTAQKTLIISIDAVNSADTSRDVTVSFYGTRTAAYVANAINDAVGADVASVITYLGDSFVQIASTTYGAKSSVTLRKGAGALKILFGASFDDTKEYRVEGAGFRGQDDLDNDLFTPWIEFYQGGYFVDGVDTAFPAVATPNTVWAVLQDLEGATNNAKASAVTFTGGSPTVPLVAGTSSVPGDQFWADGVQVGSAEVIKVEASRFKLGKLNATLSTFNDEGIATSRIYDVVEVNTVYHSNAFAPKNAYFVADGLAWPNILPAGVAATVTGAPTTAYIRDARSAYVQSSVNMTFPVNLAGLTLVWQLTEDGVQADEQTYTFSGGPFADMAALVTALSGDLDGVTVSNADDRLVLYTTKTGADQSLSVKPSGTANGLLEFSTSVAVSDSGKDVEYASRAFLTSALISLPLVGETSATLSLTVIDSKGTHTISASSVDLSSATTMGDLIDVIATAFGGSPSDPTLYDGGIAVATLDTSDAAAAYGTFNVRSVEGGDSVSISLEATNGADGWRHLGFYDSVGGRWAEITSISPVVFPIAGLDGDPFQISYTDGATTLLTSGALAGADGLTTAAELAEVLNSITAITEISGTRVVWYVGDDTLPAARTITVRTVKGGAAISLAGANQLGNAQLFLGVALSDTGATGSNAEDDGLDRLKSTTLDFSLDLNPYVYEVTFTSNSVQAAVDDINEAVGGSSDVASLDGDNMVLTSQLKGAASAIRVYNTGGSGAEDILGLTVGLYEGSGRPDPDFYLDGSGTAVIGASILRNGTSGYPFSLESALADIYIQYSALRKDVSAMAAEPALLSFGQVSDMEAAIGPVSVDNPLALGAFLAMQNAPTVGVSVLGLDEKNAAAPQGTIDAWARGLEMLESKEVYAIAPLTSDSYVNQLVSAHVQTMSQATNRGERICFLWQPSPVRADDVTVVSGTSAQSMGTLNTVQLESNPASELVSQGFDISTTIPVSDNLYLEVLVVESGVSDLRRYSVSFVNGVILTLRVSFAASENADGFYSTTAFPASGLSGLDWSLKVRGDTLYVAGTSRLDLNQVAESAASQASAYQSRRVYLLYGSSIDTSVNGITQNVPCYYASAAIAGMVAQQAPQQPFTNVPMAGFGKVYGTDDTFSENQMDVIADGGRYVLVNQGGAVSSRHARSTSVTSIEERELSITKSIDWLAKGLRNVNRVFIGRFVISQGFLDQLTMANQGFLQYAVQLGVTAKAELRNILQSAEEPDTVLIEVEATPQYPCNKIRVTIVA